MHWTEDGWDDLNDDDESEPCRACGGSDDFGHAGDCPNNPCGINYRETHQQTAQINAMSQKQSYLIVRTDPNCNRFLAISASSNDADRNDFLYWIFNQLIDARSLITIESTELKQNDTTN